MKFTLTIGVDNEAFGDDPRLELARILEHLSQRLIWQERLETLKFEGVPVWDINGNRVGVASLEK